jgi:hypothetical protein
VAICPFAVCVRVLPLCSCLLSHTCVCFLAPYLSCPCLRCVSCQRLGKGHRRAGRWSTGLPAEGTGSGKGRREGRSGKEQWIRVTRRQKLLAYGCSVHHSAGAKSLSSHRAESAAPFSSLAIVPAATDGHGNMRGRMMGHQRHHHHHLDGSSATGSLVSMMRGTVVHFGSPTQSSRLIVRDESSGMRQGEIEGMCVGRSSICSSTSSLLFYLHAHPSPTSSSSFPPCRGHCCTCARPHPSKWWAKPHGALEPHSLRLLRLSRLRAAERHCNNPLRRRGERGAKMLATLEAPPPPPSNPPSMAHLQRRRRWGRPSWTRACACSHCCWHMCCQNQ